MVVPYLPNTVLLVYQHRVVVAKGKVSPSLVRFVAATVNTAT